MESSSAPMRRYSTSPAELEAHAEPRRLQVRHQLPVQLRRQQAEPAGKVRLQVQGAEIAAEDRVAEEEAASWPSMSKRMVRLRTSVSSPQSATMAPPLTLPVASTPPHSRTASR